MGNKETSSIGSGAILNQYTEQQVAFWIDGYYTVCPSSPETKTPEAAFEKAKSAVIRAFEKHIAEVEAMQCGRFLEMKAKGI
jgi:hypothetical protein